MLAEPLGITIWESDAGARFLAMGKYGCRKVQVYPAECGEQLGEIPQKMGAPILKSFFFFSGEGNTLRSVPSSRPHSLGYACAFYAPTSLLPRFALLAKIPVLGDIDLVAQSACRPIYPQIQNWISKLDTACRLNAWGIGHVTHMRKKAQTQTFESGYFPVG